MLINGGGGDATNPCMKMMDETSNLLKILSLRGTISMKRVLTKIIESLSIYKIQTDFED